MDGADTTALGQALAGEAGVAAAVLFGSAARDLLRADSDIDVAVLLEDERARGEFEHGFVDTLGRLALASGRDVHLIDLDRSDPALRRSVFRSGRVLFDRSGGRLARLKAATWIAYVDGEHLRAIVDQAQRRHAETALG